MSTIRATESKPSPRRAKDIFGDCALVEIIHLHDCFRGALKNLEVDVSELCREITAAGEDAVYNTNSEGRISDLERRVAGRFTVIWSVFRAHSAAEDEFIWPALKAKQVDIPDSSCNCEYASFSAPALPQPQPAANGVSELQGGVAAAAAAAAQGNGEQQQRERAHSITVHKIEQEEYEEDHIDEERMFNSINGLLSNLRDELSNRRKASVSTAASGVGESNTPTKGPSLRHLAQKLLEGTGNLMKHLMTHLDKEETHCMPLVAQYLTKAEINDLVGKIMGKRSSELMSQILTMAVQNLNEADRDDMVRYMKQAMVGTFFERWLKMGGWMEKTGAKQEDSGDGGGKMPKEEEQETKVEAESDSKPEASMKDPPKETIDQPHNSSIQPYAAALASVASTSNNTNDEAKDKHTSASELEKLIRAIGTNPHLDAGQKNLTIQGLRDSVWKSNCRLSKRKREEGNYALSLEQPAAQVARMAMASTTAASAQVMSGGNPSQAHHMSFSVSSGGSTRFKRETPPSSYFKKMGDGAVKLVWSSDPHSTQFHPNDGSVPLFSASELAPTYHDGGFNHVLGCPHYARSCKLRHPTSGRLYPCRLCCEQTREMTTQDKDSSLDRYEVKEVLCIRCGALQPAGDKCVNPECQSVGKPFARYTCGICNFYDDSSTKSIYHCPFCNVCRSGQGLGIDYRHCMRCNACVSMKDEHHCIPQRLQGNCPICHETMFESTEPLRGLKCGHVMHLNCFSMYMRGHSYTCPLCKKSAEDMGEYFALLDSAVRMQPMPPAYAATTSNIYCQDCCKMGNVSYHFVGLKCQHCGSYNTRELQRVDANIMASLWQGN
mmetsp:Transcript_23732/g.51339  ORF Transcript_23732/g.51339 Transcript_23732/m.51339 type:complete len:834 (+) Transcript_23732:114-2615(+)|eukprot:CAMPEP_0172307420 /NCGR_PEP_ID=MMETSP1058-20130122/8288_1 /TAXON_ID=83371 /ORGANISM="Detonula confervacea, Strain CCMP 353" /LENGTH=833 /DNA_ID=CAMNT_0013019587 /DNA_START=89 /DNA_END=2590 /DNA_ORIENTATION=+